MNPEILKDLLPRLKADFKFRESGGESGDRLIQGTCPSCGKKELYTFKDRPWVLRCGRLNTCAAEISVKEEYPDLFDNWSNRFQKTDENPNAAADAYLISRGLDISALHGAYSQENFWDPSRKIGSATVRFQLRNESWWERLIDQPSRFEKKANFRPKGRDGSYGYGGYWWAHPKDTIEKLANAPEIWIAEGIFDAIALRMAGKAAVSSMSVSNYCDKSLKEIVKFHTENDIKTRPTLVFAYDIGKAGADYTKKHIERARAEGWNAIAAQPADEDKSKKSDWNDLLQAEKLEPENFQDYLYFGALLTAESAMEKAFLLYAKTKANSFYFHFENRTFWCKFNQQTFNDARKEELSEKKSTELALSISEIMSAKTHCLYFQRNQAIDETHYYFEITLPNGKKSKDRFSGAQISAAGDFKKRLLSVAPGAQFTGNTAQLERIIGKQTANLKTVNTLDFTGYSRDHKAYVLGDFAVSNGRVYTLNSEDYFDIGKHALKLQTQERYLQLSYQEKINTSWQEPFWTAFREKGIVILAAWIMSLFAEQIRAKHSSLAFLEITGEPGSGKSQILEFLWKLFGRENYEGFDPTKATSAAIARNLGRVGNLPVVMIEGDRNSDVAHSKRFEWDELKTAYNGRSVRSRGVKNGGNETYEPPFRGALFIVQNYQVDASPALMERIMAVSINKEKWWSSSTKNAADQIAEFDFEKLSGSIIHFIKQENEWLKTFFEEFTDWENRFFDNICRVRNQRIRKNHAQLHAAIDACFSGENPLLKWDRDKIHAAHDIVDEMAKARDKGLQNDHPLVGEFWDVFDYLLNVEKIKSGDPELLGEDNSSINLHRDPDKIAVNLNRFADLARKHNQTHPPLSILKKHLTGSKTRKFIEVTNVNSQSGKVFHAWCFWRAGYDPKKSQSGKE